MDSPPLAAAPRPARPRYHYLDWLRGLASITMLQGHTLHSFTRVADQPSSLYQLVLFVGGLAPAVFLFLTGATLGFLMDSRERLGWTPRQRVLAALRRAGYLATLAFAFRLQLWLFAWGQSPWQDLFKVDVFNCMAASLAILAPLAALDGRRRAEGALLACLVATLLAPVFTALNLDWLPWPLTGYLRPDLNQFPLFPWGAFVAGGLATGVILRGLPAERTTEFMQWAALAGFGLLLGGRYFAGLPYTLYARSEFWLNSPTLTTIKLGLLLLSVAAAYLWSLSWRPDAWSWVRQLGTASLVVYWVHVELVYGRWFGKWKNTLSVYEAQAAALVLTAAMLALAMAWPHRRAWLGRWRARRSAGAMAG